MDTIKCGRVTYRLVNGDAVMDNGACYQLIRKERDIHEKISTVSKAAFKEYRKLRVRKRIKSSHWGDKDLTYWVYCGQPVAEKE